jgi:NitT/TauT family transport system ATP-binding protein
VEFGGESPVAILGTSGCGKTTLLNLIAGLRKPDAGDIVSRSDSLSMVFQEPRLLPWRTVCENVSLPLMRCMSKKAALDKAMRYLALVSLEDKAGALPAELSGGQAQRANLARAFACPCDLLLMDEPFQALDIPMRIDLMDITRGLIEKTAAETNKAPLVIMVTHDPREAVYMGKRIIVLGNCDHGIVFDEKHVCSDSERVYGSAAQGLMERKILEALR